MMTIGVINIAKNTKEILTKNFQIVNSKKTNQKFRTWSKKYKLMLMEVWLKSNLRIDEESETNQEVCIEL